MDRFTSRQRHLEASRRVRETFARYTLADVLHWAFSLADEITGPDPDEALPSFLYGLAGDLRTVEPAWAPVAEGLPTMPVETVRAELREAFATIRGIAQDVAKGAQTDWIPVTVQLFVSHPSGDREGRPRWHLHGRLRDALVWTALKLFSEVPRSLIRPCALPGCKNVYVASKNQRYCLPHQREAYRQTQRRAERAFRARQRSQRTRKTKRKR
jgi:hypothetical protein